MERFGERVSRDIYEMGRECEVKPPTLEHIDAWGNRVDNIQTCDGWRRLHDVSAEEGLIAIAYEKEHGQWRFVCHTELLCTCFVFLIIIFVRLWWLDDDDDDDNDDHDGDDSDDDDHNDDDDDDDHDGDVGGEGGGGEEDNADDDRGRVNANFCVCYA